MVSCAGEVVLGGREGVVVCVDGAHVFGGLYDNDGEW